jgi:hypothetical protein
METDLLPRGEKGQEGGSGAEDGVPHTLWTISMPGTAPVAAWSSISTSRWP